MASSSNSPCAACKFLRRKCTQECVFAPYFPPDHPQRFAHVHKVFGASNVSKILTELSPAQREDAVNSLAWEADMRLRDPVYGCVGLISVLQTRLKQVQQDLHVAKKELAAYLGPSAMMPLSHPHHVLHQAHPPAAAAQYGAVALGGMPQSAQAQLLMREQQMFDSQQLAAALAAREQQEMMRSYGQQQQQQQQQQEMVRFNGGGGGFEGGGGGAVATGFTQMNAPSPSSMSLAAASPSSVALVPFENPFQVQQQQQEQEQQHQHTHVHHHSHHQRNGSDDGRSLGPSS